jgi:hypothetical protein
MKKVAILAGVLISIVAPQAKAQARCVNAQLQGLYSFVVSGTAGGAPFGAAGTGLYDGSGGVTGVIFANNGTPAGPIAWSGTYTMNPDCTATKTAIVPGLGTLHFFISAGDNFSELRFVAMDAGFVLTGTARRLY